MNADSEIMLQCDKQLAVIKIGSGAPVERAVDEAVKEVSLRLVLSELERRGLFGHISRAIH